MRSSFTIFIFISCMGVLSAQPCSDLQNVDFGPCDAFLGYGLIDGTCTPISGCSMVGSDGINYSEHFASSLSGCQALCQTDECVDLAEVDFGPCLALIGVGLVNGQCVAISGCGTVGSDNVDYVAYIYPYDESCEEQCDEELICGDLSNADFGDCEMILGFGLVEGVCSEITGCSTVAADGIDYADQIFSSLSGCQAECEEPDCIDLGGVDFGLCQAEIGYALINGTCTSVTGCGTVGSDGVDYADYFYTNIEDCENCDDTICADLTTVDFGDCEMLLGYGLVNGECSPISGCSTVALDGIDYAEHIFANSDECEANCISDCVDPELIDLQVLCPAVYDPVCGCDNVTYSNECVATYHYGVTSFVEGECETNDIKDRQKEEITIQQSTDLKTIYIKQRSTEEIRIKIFDLLGRIVVDKISRQEVTQIDMANRQPAGYVICIFSDGQIVLSRPVIIQ